MKRHFQGKNVLITGAGGNLGTSICQAFGEAGACIIALDLSTTALEKLKTYLGDTVDLAFMQACDLSDENDLKQTIAAAQQQFGAIDVLVNNAGITHIQRINEVVNPMSVLRNVIEVNLFAAAHCTVLVLDDLIQQRGLVINISSVAGFAPLLGRTAYAASKHALHGYFESLRNDLVKQGVQCLMVCPSFIEPNPAVVDLKKVGANSIYQQKKTLGKTASPDAIAAKILKAAQRNRPRLIVGQAGHIAYFLRRYFPRFYERVMRRRLEQQL